MKPWKMDPWQVAMFNRLAKLGDGAQVIVNMPRQYGHRVKTMVVRHRG